jgi:hypothetical protein
VELLVSDDADNGSSAAPESNLRADRFAIRKEPSRRGSIDQRNRRCRRAVAVVEQPATNQRERHRLEVPGADPPDRDLRPQTRFRLAADDRKRIGEARIERMVACNRDGSNTRQCRGSRQQRRGEYVLFLEIRPAAEVDRITPPG